MVVAICIIKFSILASFWFIPKNVYRIGQFGLLASRLVHNLSECLLYLPVRFTCPPASVLPIRERETEGNRHL